MTAGEDRSPDMDALRFMQVVSMFQMAAMQQLGKLVNPVTNETDRDLDQARASIDILEMLKRRTEGNRTEDETSLLEKVLFELHMNYVDEVRAARSEKDEEAAGKDAEGGDTTESGGEPAGDDDPDKQ